MDEHTGERAEFAGRLGKYEIGLPRQVLRAVDEIRVKPRDQVALRGRGERAVGK